MMILSFAWTTKAFLAGRKTVTRRDWKPKHAAKFHAGDSVAAWSRKPSWGGQRIGTIRLTQKPVLESTALAPDSDYEAEGFEFLDEIGESLNGRSPPEVWRDWKENPRDMYTVRFETVEVRQVA